MNIGTKFVPYEGPADAPLWLVGESPGSDEVENGRPFVGASGQKLRECLARHGMMEGDYRLLNLSHYQPYKNKFETLLGSKELNEGLEELKNEIRIHNPRTICALGGWPLHYLTGHMGRKKGKPPAITKWRGSILPSLHSTESKVVASYHPAYILPGRSPKEYPIFDNDVRRAVEESNFTGLNYPDYKFIIDPREDELRYWVEKLSCAENISVDIESVKKSFHILCVGFGLDEETAVVIPFRENSLPHMDAIQTILASKAKKIFHNGGAFDIPVLAANNITVSNYAYDTMVAQHVMWPELPKSLDYLGSIYTRQPYYKTAGRAEIPGDQKGWDDKFDKRALYEYNATDCCVTIKSHIEQQKEISSGPEEWKKLIKFELESLEMAAEISSSGLMIDVNRREELRKLLELKWAINQFVLEQLTTFRVNVNSPKQMRVLLYDKKALSLPERRQDGELTTDEDAIVSLIGFVKNHIKKLKPGGAANEYWIKRKEALDVILRIRGIRKLLSSYIKIKISDDNRLRATFKAVSTETGRWACSAYIDGTGTNAQTFPREVLEFKQLEENPIVQEMLKIISKQAEEDNGNGDEEGAGEVDGNGIEGPSVSEL